LKTNLLKALVVSLAMVAAVESASGQCLNPYSVSTVPAMSAPTTFYIQLLANQLDHGGNPANNTLDILFSSLPNKSIALKWNSSAGSFVSSTKGTPGWGSGATLNPGEGAILKTLTPQTVTFTGTPRSLVNPVTITPGTWYLLSSQLNCPAVYNDIVGGGTPPFNGLSLYRLKQSIPFQGAPAGLMSPFDWPRAYDIHVYQGTAWVPFAPQVRVGEAVWLGPEAPSISGMVYKDASATCTVDAPLQNWLMKVTGIPTSGGTFVDYTKTDLNGNYVFHVPYGTYNVQEIGDACWTPTCPSSGIISSISVNSGSEHVANQNFGVKPINGSLPDLSVQVYATYYAPYCSPCCTQPMDYHIYYRNGCVKSPWSQLEFSYSKDSIFNILPTTPIVPNGVMIDLSPGLSMGTGNGWPLGFMKWKIPPMNPGEIGHIVVHIFSPTDGQPTGYIHCNPAQVPAPVLTGIATITPVSGGEANWANNSFAHQASAACSFDPNDKQVSPKGCGPSGLINSQPLTYTVHFQNLGSGPAFNVVVDDVLDPSLDPSTVEMIGASDDYALEINGQELIWTFPNIYLPAAVDDEPGSHGFLTCRVSPFPGLAEGTVITNQAVVYFDNNAPVYTPTTTNTITTNVMPAASFTVAPRPGSANHTNDFTYTGGTPSATFLWDFCSNSVPATSTNMNPTGVVFGEAGYYNVTLQVSRDGCTAEPAAYRLAVGRPVLQIGLGAQLGLTWEGDGYSLQQTPYLGPQAILWQTVQPEITRIGSTCFTSLDITNTSMFYRLSDQP